MTGKVYIIGAGPGDPGLITLKASEYIAAADVIVYDRLVNPSLLSRVRDDAELVYAGKSPGSHTISQEEINSILSEKALEGKLVARVKGGDPFLFGRGGEEAQHLHKKGIPFEVVPGISSAFAVPAYAGIPVTHRGISASLHIITGHEKIGNIEDGYNYKALAELEGTLVILMGVENLPVIVENLISNGKSPQTPTAVIENGTTSRQRIVLGTLDSIVQKVHKEEIQSPSVIVIGDVVNLHRSISWLQQGRLSGKSILITRPREQAEDFLKLIENWGGETFFLPTVKIDEIENNRLFDDVLSRIKSFKWIVFTSVNGVRIFFKRMIEKNIDIRTLNGIEICAIGSVTAEELKKTGIQPDYIPDKYTSSNLVKGLLTKLEQGVRVLLVNAEAANREIADRLYDSGVEFEELKVYRTIHFKPSEGIINLLRQRKPDFVTFASPSAVEGFVSMVGSGNLDIVSGAGVVCIGPVTAEAAEKAGLKVSGIADVHTVNGLLDKILEISEG